MHACSEPGLVACGVCISACIPRSPSGTRMAAQVRTTQRTHAEKRAPGNLKSHQYSDDNLWLSPALHGRDRSSRMCMARGHRHVPSAVAARPLPPVAILFGIRLLFLRAASLHQPRCVQARMTRERPCWRAARHRSGLVGRCRPMGA